MISRRINRWSSNPLQVQNRIFKKLIVKARNTHFGKDHQFETIRTYEDFKKRVPIASYEERLSYVNRFLNGEENVLWPGKPNYIVGTSGTTSGIKYVPLSKESVGLHFGSARNATINYCNKYGHLSIFDGKLLFLSGSPKLDKIMGIPSGRLSGIVNHQIPSWLRANQLPSYETNIIDDWEEKVKNIAIECIGTDLRMVSGMPPWMMMFFEYVLDMTGQNNIIDVFPNLELFVHGGVNFEPYTNRFDDLIGAKITSLETYPSTEGFIGFQDHKENEGLLLNLDGGIYFEFIPVEDVGKERQRRYNLEQVLLDQEYIVIINNNAGLFAYDLGDTIRFVGKNPYRIIVTGRTQHFISAFGEHVISKEVEEALKRTSRKFDQGIIEFTVAPQVNPEKGKLPYHEWLIEFALPPKNIPAFKSHLDLQMQELNFHYKELVQGSVIAPLKITEVPTGSFRAYMKSEGKMGGQNKMIRLCNNRSVAQKIISIQIPHIYKS
jgi:hypothetical protein